MEVSDCHAPGDAFRERAGGYRRPSERVIAAAGPARRRDAESRDCATEVLLDGLLTDEQPVGDLQVRQAPPMSSATSRSRGVSLRIRLRSPRVVRLTACSPEAPEFLRGFRCGPGRAAGFEGG